MAVAGQEAYPTCVTLDAAALHDLLSPVNQMCTMADLLFTKYRGSLDSEAEALFGFIQGAAVRKRPAATGRSRKRRGNRATCRRRPLRCRYLSEGCD